MNKPIFEEAETKKEEEEKVIGLLCIYFDFSF